MESAPTAKCSRSPRTRSRKDGRARYRGLLEARGVAADQGAAEPPIPNCRTERPTPPTAVLGALVQPGRERGLDLSAAAGISEAHANSLVIDHEQGRKMVNGEALGELRAKVGVDALQAEGVVVVAAL